MFDKDLNPDEEKILFIITQQIEELALKSLNGPLSLDDCKKIQILHDSLTKIIHKGNQEDKPQTLNLTPEEFVAYLDKLTPSSTVPLTLIKDDNDKGSN